MLLARIVCSDRHCTEELEVAVESLDELDGFVCECGHGFVLTEVSELRESVASVVSLSDRRPAGQRRAA
jgi:hypothetical protein